MEQSNCQPLGLPPQNSRMQYLGANCVRNRLFAVAFAAKAANGLRRRFNPAQAVFTPAVVSPQGNGTSARAVADGKNSI